MTWTLSDIKGRCRVTDDGHWLWTGATSNGSPRVWAPDFTRRGGAPSAQVGRRAVWHVKTGKAIPNGWRVFSTCNEPMCLRPEHIDAMSPAQRGVDIAEAGTLKGRVKRIAANRAINRRRSNVTPELIALVLASKETGVALAARLGLKRQTISKIRCGRMFALQPVGGVFSGLLASNDSSARRSA